jgi:hypothetical protein
MHEVLHNARLLSWDASSTVSVLALGALSILLLRGAEVWGDARARRRTAAAIAAAERASPPLPPTART